jgi:hypothetical protein
MLRVVIAIGPDGRDERLFATAGWTRGVASSRVSKLKMAALEEDS